MSFNEANGDITKHPAAYIYQETSRLQAFDACLSSRGSRIPPPVLSSDFSVFLLKWKWNVKLWRVSIKLSDMAARCTWVCKRLVEIRTILLEITKTNRRRIFMTLIFLDFKGIFWLKYWLLRIKISSAGVKYGFLFLLDLCSDYPVKWSLWWNIITRAALWTALWSVLLAQQMLPNIIFLFIMFHQDTKNNQKNVKFF